MKELASLWELLIRLSAARAGYLDELAAANIPTDLTNIIAYVDLIDDGTNGLAAIKAEVEGLAGAAMRGTDGAALAASWTAALATALGNYNAARAGYLDELNAPNIPADVDTLKTQVLRGLYTKDQWCATPIASLAFSNGAGDKNFANVVFPANFLPAGAVINSVFLMLHWRKQVDSSAGANAVNGAGKTIRVMKSGGGWLADSVVGITMADNELATAASATEGGTIIIGSANIATEVDDTNGITYNIQTNETNFAGTSIVVDGASLTLYDLYTGLRVVFKLG